MLSMVVLSHDVHDINLKYFITPLSKTEYSDNSMPFCMSSKNDNVTMAAPSRYFCFKMCPNVEALKCERILPLKNIDTMRNEDHTLEMRSSHQYDGCI